MKEFVRLFLDIALLRKAPQDVPDSGLLLGLLLIVDVLVSTLLGIVEGNAWEGFLQALTAAGILLAFTGVLLLLTGHQNRLRRTASAALGCDALITLMAFPLTVMSRLFEGLGMLFLMVIVWNFVVYAHILRHALGIGWALGGVLALIQLMVTLDLMARVFAN
jgi:hypothetical protein